MPELRKDPLVRRWVIIATERAKRPDDFKVEHTLSSLAEEKECPFCPGREHLLPPEIYSQRDPVSNAWQVRVVSSKVPLLQIEGDLGRRGHGMYDLMNGIGAHETIIDTPDHIPSMADLSEEQIGRVFAAYRQRMEDLEGDRRIKYVLICKNHGAGAGASPCRHSRTQLIGLPVNPRRVKEELSGSRRYYEYRERCLFCDLIHQEIRDGSRIIARHNGFVAIAPFASRFPFEIWVLPEDHSCDFYRSRDSAGLGRMMKTVLKKLSVGLNDPPYNFMIHTAPFRRITSTGHWRTVEHDYHWHIEIMPRLTRMAGFEWGSGFYINPTPPEDAAGFLRDTEV